MATEGIEYTAKPAYNGVYVYGGSSGGRIDFVKRTNTDGATLAPTIVDALATDPIMSRQRGLRALGDTGNQAIVTLKLPILPDTGIILPGAFVGYVVGTDTKRGMVRGVSVDYALPVVRQTIKVETHEYI